MKNQRLLTSLRIPTSLSISMVVALALATALTLGSAACGRGGPEPGPAASSAPTTVATPVAQAETPPAEPTPGSSPAALADATPMPGPTAAEIPASVDPALAKYAEEHAGGPGAIFVGDPNQLIGPPPHEGLTFRVPQEKYTQTSMAGLFGAPDLGVASHMFIFTSDYYQGLLEKAKFTNPTQLTSSGESIEIQHACISRNLPTCILIQAYWAPNLAKRTDGQVKLSVVSFPELGLAGPDTLDQVSNGTLDMANIYGGYVSGALPALEMQSLWGMSRDWETTYSVLTDVSPYVDLLLLTASGGSHVLNRNWFAGSDQWFYSNKPLRTLEDFEGLKIRSHGAAMSDFITGMGGEATFLGPGESYLALELGQVDAAAYSSLLAISDRIYEVADYMAGPVIGFGYTNNVINKDVWRKIPPDLQQIITEEGAKAELEALRLAPFQNVVALQLNQQLGVQPVPFSEEIQEHIRTVVMRDHVVPGWVRRLGYPGRNAAVIAVANRQMGSYIGLQIGPEGAIVEVDVTKGSRSK